MLPVELVLHALVLRYHLSYLATVLLLVLSTTVLIIWVIEPSTMRLLRPWLHAPEGRTCRDLSSTPALWRLRVTVDDGPGALEGVTHQLARLGGNILGLHVHPLEHGSLDEFILATQAGVEGDDILSAARAGGGLEPTVDRTSAVSLVDGPTMALDLAREVAVDTAQLPRAAAKLLGATVLTDRRGLPSARSDGNSDQLLLRTPWTAPIRLSRPGVPFTPAEIARADRLSSIAETAVSRAAAIRTDETAAAEEPAR